MEINTKASWIERATGAKATELSAALISFAYFFCLLASYYVLRPIRDEMAIQIGQKNLAELFTWVFLTMLAVVPLFGWLMATFPRKKILPWLYLFFVANLIGFYAVMGSAGEQTPIIARVFYIWVSVYNLFVISVFWSFMADLFDSDQAKRLYGFIAAGGTVGALAGPIITTTLVASLGAKHLMLVSGGFLLAAVGLIFALIRWEKSSAIDAVAKAKNDSEDVPIGGSVWAGIVDVVRSRYLLAICVFLFAYAILSSLLYFAQVEMLPKAIASSVERTQLLAKVDLVVNCMTLFVQVFAFGALVQRLGTRFMLVAMPVVSIVGFVALALNPVLGVLLVFGVMRRAGEYSISKPARETLFNVLPPEQKYKAKNVIDTLVHRTGDVSSTWILTGLKSIGMNLSSMSWLAVPIGLVWLATAWWLGGEAKQRQQSLEGNDGAR